MELVLETQSLNTIQRRPESFKSLLQDTFLVYRETGPYPLKFHLSGNLIKTLNHFRFLDPLGGSINERFHFHVNRVYRIVSRRHTFAVEEIFSAIHMNTHRRKQELHESGITI